ncbi:hypothetical protein FA048_00075 [Pedobacter polaris]|uniref:Fibronectin type-III domain-containing protein n=1 Tax=Pedobacter polaris TaxID=2571273 RepID=A0A4U1CSG6_9SPHI|nr:hypothetical protein [Pedobacter polaris]TKC12051.1 hypothetical protein FA048_00075 [Pedobacter polaris]
MVLLAPTNNLETSNYQLTFWWEMQQDALGYRLQVVSTDFSNIQKLILDTLVKKDKFTYTLDPGKYQWRVRAENGSSQTSYTTQSFIVHPSSLTNNVIQLTSPTNNFFTSSPDVKLEWLNLFGATQYRVQLDNQNFIDENNLVLNVTTTNLSFLKTLSKEGNYQFRVRGESTTENSKWSVVRNFSYDATPPVQVKLTAPLNNKTVAKPVQLTWNSITDAEKYELIVYQSDLTTLYSTSYPMLLTTNTYTFNAGDSNEVIGWKVRAIDKAGNKGSFSDLFSFTIQ